MDRVILRKWLKAGYMEKHVLHETTDGTPQVKAPEKIFSLAQTEIL
jgi:hypothetical protein